MHPVQGDTPGDVLTWPIPVPTDGNAWPAPSRSDEGECTLAGLTIFRSAFASAGDSQLVTHIMQIHSFGWPLPVLEQVVQGSSISPTVEWRTLGGRLIAVSLSAAVAAAALTALARWNIARRRKLRNCCAFCGYPLVHQGAAACPGCGSDCPTLSSRSGVTPGPT